jgi:hypothetical protein
MHLAKCGHSIEDVTTGFTSGVELIHLLQVISDETIPRFNKNPKMRIQKIENLNTALKFISDHDVKLASIGSEEIADGNAKLTLGMIWTIILRFAISGLSEEGVSAKQGLLLWVQKKTQGYKGVNVQDFSESFKDGLAFDALIHHHRPDLLSFDEMDPANPASNLDSAFDAGEKLGVPKLLDTADIVEMDRPDERSIMTYCAALYKVFSSYDKVDTAARRLGKFLGFSKQVEDMKHDYIERATRLSMSASQKTEELGSTQVAQDYASVRQQIAAFKEYRKTDKRAWTVESSDLASLFSNIQAKLRIIGRPAFVPPENLAPIDLDSTIQQLTAVELSYRNTISETMRQILDLLRKSYADLGNALVNGITEFRKFVGSECECPIEEQPQIYQAKKAELINLVEPQLPALMEAERVCDEANIDENEYCQETYEDIKFMYEQLIVVVDKKLLFINAQIMEAKGDVPADKIAEFRESFEMFDSDKNNELSKLEFRSAATSLGLVEVDFGSGGGNKECDDLFVKISGGSNVVSFEQWVKYMTSITEDACTTEHAEEAFSVIADGKEWITDADIERAHLPADQVEFISTNMPRNEHGYDYKGWLAQN